MTKRENKRRMILNHYKKFKRAFLNIIGVSFRDSSGPVIFHKKNS